MAAGTEHIKESLEKEFDVPFTVKLSYEFHEPVFMIAPEDPGKELFAVRVAFESGVRITMDFVSQDYSADFLLSMGNKPIEQRKVFLSYAKLMIGKGAEVSIAINGEKISLSEPENWPSQWKSFDAEVTRMPFSGKRNPSYEDAVCEWGSLMIGMVLSLADIVPVKQNEKEGDAEGGVSKVGVNRYERSPINRQLCIAAHGYKCLICGFDFEEMYGELGKGFIHVHHIVPISEAGEHTIDPINDLIPVCPNCHAMLHRRTPPFLPEELREIIKTQ